MSERKQRQVFEQAFKLEAVKMIVDQGKKVREVAAELGIKEVNLLRWKKEFSQKVDSNGKIPSNIIDLEAENRKLRQDNMALRQERDFLKKTAGYFAKNQR